MSADDKYLDFEITIWEDAGTYRARACSPAGSSAIAPLPAIIGSTGSAANVRLRLENSMLRGTKHIRGVPSSAERHLEEFGHAIFDGLLGPSSPFSALFQASLLIASSQHPRVKGLRLVLGIEAPELAQLPWEYLYDAARHQWLGLSYGSPIVRFLVVDRPSGVIDVDGPLNVLGIIANPGGEWPLLDAEGERNRIEQAMKNLARERRIKFS
ncbi:hypothetical protein [Noviherbaspirillum aridicola]|uniref:Uncharacterized protein n=1 Tax=Noviherbaspirillum aridicola TaxID=2849687 RepID=A0ABQ4Q090_9BURK|nr:hypothetical protein [Noviherbaspirillum aridicola]GIZ50562.1 hypothetical protein NCCP691_05760 [Noviherbaspirillum aridicola]